MKDAVRDVDVLATLNETMGDVQAWFSTHSVAAMMKKLAKSEGYKGLSTFMWPAVTRFVGKLLQMRRLLKRKPLLQQVVTCHAYVEQHFEAAGDGDPIKPIVMGTEIWEKLEAATKVMGPLLLVFAASPTGRRAPARFCMARWCTRSGWSTRLTATGSASQRA